MSKKCEVMSLNLEDEHVMEAASVLGCKVGKLSMDYLGVLFPARRLFSKIWGFLLLMRNSASVSVIRKN